MSHKIKARTYCINNSLPMARKLEWDIYHGNNENINSIDIINTVYNEMIIALSVQVVGEYHKVLRFKTSSDKHNSFLELIKNYKKMSFEEVHTNYNHVFKGKLHTVK